LSKCLNVPLNTKQVISGMLVATFNNVANIYALCTAMAKEELSEYVILDLD